MRPTRTWLNGMSTRMDFKRLEKLRKSKAATTLFEYFETIADHRIKTLRTFAAINQEQTLAAFRVTLLGNVSVPILLVTFTNQITGGGVTEIFRMMQVENPMVFSITISGLIGGVIAIALVAIYALANLGQARDLRHLIDIYAAERRIYFGLEDMSDLNLS